MEAFRVISAVAFLLFVTSFGQTESEFDVLDNCSTHLLQTALIAPRNPEPEYYWVQRGGKPTNFGSTKYAAPRDLSKKPAWIWQNSDDEQVRHSPLIDDKMNIYIMTAIKLRKFDPNGSILWTWHPEEGTMTASPALYQGGVYLLSVSQGSPSAAFVTVHSVDMESGQLRWKKHLQGTAGGDSQSMFVYNDTCIVPSQTPEAVSGPGGTNKFSALSALNGSSLWEYTMDELVWNAAPTTPGDGTFLFAGSCGAAYRISFGGELIWRSGPKKEPYKYCSTGGGSLGPNGVFYTEYTKSDMSGHVSAYRVSDGSLLWERNFPKYAGNQYPAVGPLGKDGPLVVVVAIGDNPGLIDPVHQVAPLYMVPGAAQAYFNDPETRKRMGVPNHVNALVVMDAKTGNIIWRWEEETWDHFAAAGDEEFDAVKRALNPASTDNPICLPDLQAIPLIAGDGTIYASSGHGGNLTAIRDDNGNGVIEATEVSVFSPHKCFLNSPSLAPGMLVAAPCWGPVYVFKE